MAGFELTLYGRIWVTPKGIVKFSAENDHPGNKTFCRGAESRQMSCITTL